MYKKGKGKKNNVKPTSASGAATWKKGGQLKKGKGN